MAIKYVGPNALSKLCSLVKTALAGKINTSDIVQTTSATGSTKVPSADVTNDLQDQVDELNTKLTGLVQRKLYTYAYSNVAAGAVRDISGNDFGMDAISGYTPLALYNVNTGNNNVVIRVVNATATTTGTAVSIRNVGSNAASGTVTISCIWIRSSAMG